MAKWVTESNIHNTNYNLIPHESMRTSTFCKT